MPIITCQIRSLPTPEHSSRLRRLYERWQHEFKWISMFATVLAINTYSQSFVELDRAAFELSWLFSPLPAGTPGQHGGIASSVSHSCQRVVSVGKTTAATHLCHLEINICPGFLLDPFSHFFFCFPGRLYAL